MCPAIHQYYNGMRTAFRICVTGMHDSDFASGRTVAGIRRLLTVFVGTGSLTAAAYAADPIGLTLLQTVTTGLNGNGVRVAQPEAGSPTWEVNPATTGQPVSLFTYYASGGSSTAFPNALGSESGHAGGVGQTFYGLPAGVATNVAHVDNYEAGYFFQSLILAQQSISAVVVNQSFVGSGSQQQTYDTAYDNYVTLNKTIFSSGAGDGGAVLPPSTCYNGIGVGAYGGATSIGPTPDNGRAKPDLCAPADATSYSTPLVAGAAAILVQAGARGDGGGDTASATDVRTVKALLLNGAIKPADWSHPSPSPLDPKYGAGILNVFNSYKQLAGGKRGFVDSGTVSAGSAHPPTSATGNVGAPSGWDFNTLTSSLLDDAINHYYFNLTNVPAGGDLTGTATLVWNRPAGGGAINDLNLYLYRVSSGALIAASTSAVDNVEHVFIPKLPPGRYDLQVWKSGGLPSSGRNPVNTETYALAFEFFSESLSLAPSGTNVVVSWPVYPAGFVLESAPGLAPANWATVSASPVVAGQNNRVTLDASTGTRLFRLRRP